MLLASNKLRRAGAGPVEAPAGPDRAGTPGCACMLSARIGAVELRPARAGRRTAARAAPSAAWLDAGGVPQDAAHACRGDDVLDRHGEPLRQRRSGRPGAAASRAAATGSLSAQARAGGGASVAIDWAGRAASGNRPARSRAWNQVRPAPARRAAAEAGQLQQLLERGDRCRWRRPRSPRRAGSGPVRRHGAGRAARGPARARGRRPAGGGCGPGACPTCAARGRSAGERA